MSTEFKSFFKAVGGNEGGKCNYATRLDTYGCGCQHNCAYWQEAVNHNREDCCNLKR